MDYYSDLLKQKTLSGDEMTYEWKKLKDYKAEDGHRSFAGNNIIYHYFLDKMNQCATEKGDTIKGLMTNPDTLDYWVKQTEKMKRTGTFAVRLFECIRVCRCPITFFKPTIAKNMYQSVGATSVLDPCAGWGGRMLGAMALGIPYTGIDTNENLSSSYAELMSEEYKTTIDTCGGFTKVYTPSEKYRMIFKSCLDVDFSEIDYDCVLTSPPYVNLEVYQGMTPWATSKAFYEDFLIPLIDKCRKHIRRNGRVLFNISPKMYKALTETYKYEKCVADYDMLQQKKKGVDKKDRIYDWRSKT